LIQAAFGNAPEPMGVVQFEEDSNRMDRMNRIKKK
jgi:hypothetical protein